MPEFENKRGRFARPIGKSWRVDKAYILVRGEWKYHYRAVDKQGNTVVFLLIQHRDIISAKQFFTQAIDKQGAPEKITVNGYAATHTAIGELKESKNLPTNVLARISKYLRNLIERDQRRVKQRVHPMPGFKKFENAAVTIGGMQLAHKIKKGEFDTSELRLEGARAEELWQAVLAG